jgi:uncharacterized repeat protein (TIGR01451 family)
MKSGFGRIGLEGRSHRRPISIAFVLVVISSLLLAVAGPAAADRPFSPRFSQNVQGAITFAANTVMTCPDSDSRCPAAQAGTGSALNNNQFNMRYVDIDGDPATFNSSSAVLTVPSGAQVLFAGLYYDGQTTAGVGGTAAPTPSARGTVRLRVPGLPGFQTLTASVDNSTSGKYAAFVDITDQVTGAGSGSYTVANVQTGTGEDRGGGWSIVVAYRDPSEPARNLTIFDGLETVSQGETKTVGVTGFQTPASGPVRTEVGFVTYEGDRGSTGDSATLNGTVLSSATNPPNNFFNSSISKNGVLLTDKDPDYNNQLGFDAVQVNADGILANGATSAAIRLQTNRDQYMPHVVTFATEIFSPTITDVKTVQNITNPAQPARPGDTLRYTLQYTNSGGDGATQFIATDAIPGGTTYAPGSLKITSGPNAPASPTDAIGDDLAEFLPASNSVRFRLGQGASNTAGGTLSAAGGPATSTTITFEVTVGDLPSGTAISNTGEAEFLSQTLGTPQTAESNTVVNEVIAPDLEMSKSHVVPIVGVDVEFTLGVENVGTASTDGSAVTVTDSFDPSAFSAINITSAPGWNCSATSGLNLSCTRTDVLATGAPYPGIQVTGTVVASPPATFTNEAEVAGGGDNTPGNNLAVDFLPVPPTSSDLSIVKTVAPATVLPGQRITYTLEVTNAGPSNATGVTVEDSWAFSGLIDVTATPSQGTCPTVTTSSVLCEIGNLTAGGTATVEISATVDFDDSSGLLNTASVEGDQADPRPDNNESSATFDAAAASDIEVVKTAGTDPIAGEAFSYTIEVTNNGPSDADGVVFNDQIPELFTPTEASYPSDIECGPPPVAGGTLSCSLSVPLPVGSTVSLPLTGTLSPASAGVPVTNTVTAYSSEADSNPDNNSSSVTVIPLPFADIAMSKTASADSVEAGQTVTWTFIVQNFGPLDADPVILEDELPAGLAIVSLPDGCGVEETTLTCNLGALGLDESRTLALTVRPGPAFAGETITNSASVSSPRPDPNQANQSDTSSFEVTSGKTRLKLDQKVNRKKARSGGKFAFGITVSNTSDTSAYDSVVCQRLPRALKIVRAPGAKIGPGRKACWTIGRLDPDRSRQFSVLTRGFSSRNTSATAPVTLSGENVVDGRQSKTVRIVVPRKPKPPQPVAG